MARCIELTVAKDIEHDRSFTDVTTCAPRSAHKGSLAQRQRVCRAVDCADGLLGVWVFHSRHSNSFRLGTSKISGTLCGYCVAMVCWRSTIEVPTPTICWSRMAITFCA